MYLWCKDSGFFFQIRIPSNRIETMGKGHVRMWLGWVGKIEARRAAVALAGAVQTGFEMASIGNAHPQSESTGHGN